MPKEGCDTGKPVLKQALGRTCGSLETEGHAEECLLAGFMIPWENHAGAAGF